jgi:hypothetical protein
MARFYFDFFNAAELETDSEGFEVESVDCVRRQLGSLLLDVARGRVSDDAGQVLKVSVRNESGLAVLEGSLYLRVRARSPACGVCGRDKALPAAER